MNLQQNIAFYTTPKRQCMCALVCVYVYLRVSLQLRTVIKFWSDALKWKMRRASSVSDGCVVLRTHTRTHNYSHVHTHTHIRTPISGIHEGQRGVWVPLKRAPETVKHISRRAKTVTQHSRLLLVGGERNTCIESLMGAHWYAGNVFGCFVAVCRVNCRTSTCICMCIRTHTHAPLPIHAHVFLGM